MSSLVHCGAHITCATSGPSKVGYSTWSPTAGVSEPGSA